MERLVKITTLVAVMLVSFSANAAIITGESSLGGITTNSSEGFLTDYGPNVSFVHSVTFSTDADAFLVSGAAVGLELTGFSGFVGDFTLSLYEGHLNDTDDTASAIFLASAVGTNLDNISVNPLTGYSLVIEGLAAATQTNTFSGIVAITNVPLPAAAWLFGSALLGLVGIQRRKA